MDEAELRELFDQDGDDVDDGSLAEEDSADEIEVGDAEHQAFGGDGGDKVSGREENGDSDNIEHDENLEEERVCNKGHPNTLCIIKKRQIGE